jgi:uncharacterized membrane protein YhaH (DUF805 family)
MDFRFLFLEPQGRLAPKSFGRGFVLLTGACMMISVLTAVVSPGLNVLQYALVFPYICLFGKRLHDAGLTAWLWIAFLAGLGFLNMFLSAILLPLLSPGSFASQVEVQETMQTAGFTAALALHRMLVNGQHPGLGPILVTGASGGVGAIAVNLFHHLGYEVVAMSGKPGLADWLGGLGAGRIVGRDALSELGCAFTCQG